MSHFAYFVVLVVGVWASSGGAAGAAGREEGDIRFLLWTRYNPGDSQYYILQLDDLENLSGSTLNTSHPTVFVIHGYDSRGLSGWVLEAKTELLALGWYNVVSVDWEALAEGPWYPQAVDNVPGVGGRIHGPTGRVAGGGWGAGGRGVQVVGHSLGAHVAGAVGQYTVSFRLPSITGLDPAGPDFHGQAPEHRLDPTDAEFVQGIHTEGCDIIETCLGMREEVGDVDFYPNGGEEQPGCRRRSLNITGSAKANNRSCSHGRSHDFWIESINGSPPAFVSRPCYSWNGYLAGDCPTCGQGCLNMGFHVQHSLVGKYYLWTNSAPPYALG